ncbi:MAG: MFS transporter [Dermatophilaceae bacterium]
MSSLLDGVAPPRLGRPFRWLLAANWATNLADGFALAAGPLLVASLTTDPRLVSLAALVEWLPGFVLGLYAGAVADRHDRRRIVVWGNLVRAVALVALTASVAIGVVTVTAVIVTLLLVATAETFIDGASRTVLPMIVPAADLGIANARMTFGWVSLNRLVGPPIGAALFAVGAAWPFGAQTVCFIGGAVLFARIAIPRHTPQAPASERPHVVADIRAGLRWTWHHRAMRALVLQIVTFNVTFGASWGVLVLYASQRLGLDTVGFGLLTTVEAVGSIVGTVTFGWVERHVRLGDIMRYGLVLETLTHLALAVTRTPAVAMGILFLFGIHLAYWATIASSVRQRAVPADLQGRVGSVYVMAMLGGMVIGNAVGGVLAARWGITAPYWFAFVGSALILAALWRELGHIAHEDARQLGDHAGPGPAPAPDPAPGTGPG